MWRTSAGFNQPLSVPCKCSRNFLIAIQIAFTDSNNSTAKMYFHNLVKKETEKERILTNQVLSLYFQIVGTMVVCIVSAVVTSIIVMFSVFGLRFDTFASYYFGYDKEVFAA